MASGIPEKVEWEFFDLTPVQMESLAERADAGTPLSHALMRFRGNTDWRLDWDYRARDEIMRCSVDKVLLTLTIRHRLPQLPKEDLPEDVVRVFGPVYKALHAHEQQHAGHARAAAREVDRVMRMLPAQESCDILEKRLRVLVGKVLDDYRDRDERFDTDTDFGWKQVPDNSLR
jgi:predicted secreted Zn-dependent protease